MFRIRRVFDAVLPVDQRAIAAVQDILRSQFAGVSEHDIVSIPSKLADPFKHQFRSLLFVADDDSGTLRGFALVSHDPALRFLYLHYIATGKSLMGSGVGGRCMSAYGRKPWA